MVARAGLTPAPVIFAAAVGVADVAAAHGEHGAAAVAAEEKAGVYIVVYLHAAVVRGAALLAQRPRGGEGAIVDDLLMVVLKDLVVAGVLLHVSAVYLAARVLALTQSADIKIIIDDALHGDDRPLVLDLAHRCFAIGLAPGALRHARCGYALIGEVVCNALIAPAADVEREYLPHDLRLGGDDLKFLLLVYDVAVGRGADPAPVLLTALHD